MTTAVDLGVAVLPPVDKHTQIKSAVIAAHLTNLGYSFRHNLLDDIVEINDRGTVLDDYSVSIIKAEMRDRGFGNMAAVEDVIRALASKARYDPMLTWLHGLKWDGKDHIGTLCSMIRSNDPPLMYQDSDIPLPLHQLYITRWLIGAVAKVLDKEQNFVLVLDGPQNIGKSTLARWLCPISDWFTEGAIDPHNKDYQLLMTQKLVHEVSELDASLNRHDQSALKSFLMAKEITARPSYGRFAVTRPMRTSFIGTVNNVVGIFSDVTGNRRYAVTEITYIDIDLYHAVDPVQLWAQAMQLYREGEPHRLMREEAVAQTNRNADYFQETVLTEWMRDTFRLTNEAEDFMTTAEIIDDLETKYGSLSGTERYKTMEVGRSLMYLGVKKARINSQRGWSGITRKR